MLLNLAILYDDLAKWNPHAPRELEWSQPKLRRPRLLAPDTAGDGGESVLDPEVCLVADADDLDASRLGYTRSKASVICLGMPSDAVLSIEHIELVWIPAGQTTLAMLLNRIAELFDYYNTWHLALQDSLNRDMPLRHLIELSSPIFRRPLWVFDSHFQTIASVVDESLYELPPQYFQRTELEPLEEWEINLFFEKGVDVFSFKEPTILDGGGRFEYRSLATGLFMQEKAAGAIIVAETEPPFSGRDRALLTLLKNVVERKAKRSDLVNTTTTFYASRQLRRLLDDQALDSDKTQRIYDDLGWHASDFLQCVVAVPANELYQENILAVAASKACASAGAGSIYLVFEGKIVILCNTQLGGTSSNTAPLRISRSLKERRFLSYVGASTPFNDLADLRHYLTQACKFVEYGKGIDPTREVYDASFCLLPCMLNKLVADAIPEVFMPPELLELVSYDRMKDAALVETLACYLMHNCNNAQTARELHIHRNTLAERLRRIEEASSIDLDDPDRRLALLIAFALLERRGGHFPA